MAKKQLKGAVATSEAQDTNPGTWTEIKADAAPVAEGPARKKGRKPNAPAPEIEAPAVEATPAAAKTKRTAKSSVTIETASEANPTPAPKKGKRTKSNATLQDVFAAYVKGLEEQGKSDGTIASYRMELQLAGDDLGLETKVAEITPERVLVFMTSDRVMKKRNGRSKSPLSIDKTRRVLRQALQFAATKKLVAEAPLPELTATH